MRLKTRLFCMDFKACLSYLISSFLLIMLTSCGGGDSQHSSSKASLSISASPVLSIHEDVEYKFKVTTKNAVGDVNFKILNAPTWMSIDKQGIVSGVATTDAEAVVTNGIVISAVDEQGIETSLPPFDVTVIAVNDAPVIEFSHTHYFFDSGQKMSISYSIYDEEGEVVDVDVAGMQEILTYKHKSSEVTADVPVLSSVKHGQLSFIFRGDAGSFIEHRVTVSLLPVTSSGQGKTLFGSQSGPGIHIIVLGDGYTNDEMNKFMLDSQRFISLLKQDPGSATHLSAWNIHVIETPSVDSGIDDSYGVDQRDTYFDAGFNCSNISRLVCASDQTAMELALQEFPYFHQVIMVVNSEKYGGAGGLISIYSRSAPEIALHEMGHSFANLADEYLDAQLENTNASLFEEGTYANASALQDPNVVPWAHWIEDKQDFPTLDASDNRVGIFEGALYSSFFYRPKFTSRMRENNANFGEVNSEAWALQFYNHSGVVTSFTPREGQISTAYGSTKQFQVTPLFSAKIQSIRWYLNDNELLDFKNISRIEIDAEPGEHKVSVVVKDISGLIRKSPSVAEFSKSWQLTVE